MCEETQGFPIPLNGEMKTMGDIYALTPKEFVSKVMREEKVFETWYSGRVVLLGDGKQSKHIFFLLCDFFFHWLTERMTCVFFLDVGS